MAKVIEFKKKNPPKEGREALIEYIKNAPEKHLFVMGWDETGVDSSDVVSPFFASTARDIPMISYLLQLYLHDLYAGEVDL